MLAGGPPLLCLLEWVSPDDSLGKSGRVFLAGLAPPVAPGTVGRRHGSTVAVLGQCRCPDKWSSSASPPLSPAPLWPFQQLELNRAKNLIREKNCAVPHTLLASSNDSHLTNHNQNAPYLVTPRYVGTCRCMSLLASQCKHTHTHSY